jgi:hypothetical protein
VDQFVRQQPGRRPRQHPVLDRAQPFPERQGVVEAAQFVLQRGVHGGGFGETCGVRRAGCHQTPRADMIVDRSIREHVGADTAT